MKLMSSSDHHQLPYQMRDFQTWLITQVMVARGAACQVISELPVCPDCTVYTSQAAEQDNKTHLTGPKTSCAYWLSCLEVS